MPGRLYAGVQLNALCLRPGIIDGHAKEGVDERGGEAKTGIAREFECSLYRISRRRERGLPSRESVAEENKRIGWRHDGALWKRVTGLIVVTSQPLSLSCFVL